MAVRPSLIAAMLALAACGRAPAPASTPPAQAAPPPSASAPTIVYACENGETLRASYPDPQTAIIDYRGRTLTLKAAPSASGARYVGDGLQWWTKGTANGAVSALGVGETMASGGPVQCKAPAEADALTPPVPGQPGGLPDSRTPVVEAPAAPSSPQAAAQVVQTYFALIEEKQFEPARRLWSDSAHPGGKTPAAFAADLRRYREYHATIGAPGAPDGAAGSTFVSVPVQVYGRGAAGRAFHTTGEVTLRRVNDVPGATAEQRRWRIHSITLAPETPG